MQPRNPDFEARVAGIFRATPFIRFVGISLSGVGAGWCESELSLRKEHCQQDGFVHAGVQATLADHTAGGAAGSLAAADELVLSVEFKLNLLRAARGERLECRAEVLKPGRMLSVVESSVWEVAGDRRRLVSKASVTLAHIVATRDTA